MKKGYTAKEVAEHLDLSQARVNQLLAEGVLSKGRGSSAYDLDHCRVQYIRYLRSRQIGQQNQSASLNDVKIKLVQAQAEKAELEAKELQGKLIPTQEVEEYWTDFVSNCKAKILALPNKLAHRIEGAETNSEIEDLLTIEVHEALQELADDGIPVTYQKRIKESQ